MENKEVTPRAFLTSNYTVIPSEQKSGSLLMDPSFFPSKMVLIEKTPPSISTSSSIIGTVQIKTYEPNRIVFETTANTSSLLVLTDTYYPGWTATVDGTSTPILRADYTYRAVSVPEGNHIIMMQFNPMSLKIGFIVSISSILILLVIIMIL